MTKQLVLLTGSKNNAGDFLIKYRAKALFSHFYPELKIVDIDRWNLLTVEELDIINESVGLVLCGGPAMRTNIYPNIYPLTYDLTQIKVPIFTLGVGWKHSRGFWEDTYHYPFTTKSRQLLDRIESNEVSSGVRDPHTLNALQINGYNNYILTGCPALYDLNHIQSSILPNSDIKKLSISTGVSFTHSAKMRSQLYELIDLLDQKMSSTHITVVFHHSFNPKNPHINNNKFIKAHIDLTSWLEKKKIDYTDISGSVDQLIEHYTSTDFHIGYRVHAHIFCQSISKPSILIAEDGRGFGLSRLGIGTVFPGFSNKKFQNNKIMKRLTKPLDEYKITNQLPDTILHAIQYEIGHGFPALQKSRMTIDVQYEQMKKFFNQISTLL